ncbi:MAG: hypothetical protein ABIU05_22570 [Nitrospirales bacterium]
MSDCEHEWAKISIDGDESVFSCLHCGQRLEPGALSSAVIVAEQKLGQTHEAIPLEPVSSGPESHGSIAWKYESTYYHIYGQTSLVDDIFDPIFIGIPQSEPADSDVQSIVDALNRMVSRRNRED